MRLTSVHPAGGVRVAVAGVTPIEAIITSSAAAPAGSAIESELAAGRNARMWVLPTSALFEAVAVLMPVAPVAACRTQLPTMDWPAVLGGAGLATSKPSVMPVGAVQFAAEENVCAVTSTVFATVVVMLVVGWVSADVVVRPFST